MSQASGPSTGRSTGTRPASASGDVGVYVHIPYCERICPYCDFAVLAARRLEPAVEAAYLEGLLTELDQRREDFPDHRLASLYFGGGTPSLFRPETLGALIARIHEAFPIPPEAEARASVSEIETTLELNPSTTERAALPGFREAGINRLSIGVQSFNDDQLKRLGRAHRAEVARDTLRSARAAGFDNLSLDLIFAAPGQTLADLTRDLDEVLAWQPEHVSTYELTFEPQTPFGKALATGRLEAPDEDLAVSMIETIEKRLEEAGLERYEISSYARPGFRAQHNARYWQRRPVLGIGMGAHSTEARSSLHPFGARQANPRTLDAWHERLRSGRIGVRREAISEATARGEAIFLGLRQLVEGVCASDFAAEFGAPPRHFFGSEIRDLVAKGWLEEDQPERGDLVLSRTGRLWADSVAENFVEEAVSFD